MGRMVMVVAALALAFAAAQPARADFEAGQRAWESGDVGAALAEWRAAAEGGDRRAMLALGRLYMQGLGVLQDYVQAHKWLNLAASRGEAAALAERDALAGRMTQEERAEAQRLARAWRPGGGDAPDASGAQAAAAAPARAAAPDAGPPPPRAIRETQALLAALGYRPGPADGIWGRRTGEAYRAFLRDAGLPAAQTLTPEALDFLREVAARAGVADAGRDATAAADAVPAPAPRPAPTRPDVLPRAAQAGDLNGLQAALASGADVDARDAGSWTALMHAANKGYPLLVAPLLAAGATVDMRAPDGATALFMAAVHGHMEVVALLMRAGAEVSVPGPRGRTAVDVARARYGEPGALRERVEDAAVLALLEGKTWAEAEEERLARERLYGAYPPGRTFRDCAECPELVVVPVGDFMMGSPSGEKGRRKNEGPRHRVTIGAPFAVGVYEVTFGEWEACVSGGGCNGYRPDDRGWGRGNRPVVNVSWKDAKAYVEWLSRKTGQGYRLLSEAEWEYVARAGTETAYHFGSRISPGQANYSRSGHGKTVPVGSYPSNAFGLHDVHGNVWEWVEDCYNKSYRGAPSDGSAWKSGDCSGRVLRGGSWYDQPRYLRSANRYGYDAGIRNDYNGFRIARTLTP